MMNYEESDKKYIALHICAGVACRVRMRILRYRALGNIR